MGAQGDHDYIEVVPDGRSAVVIDERSMRTIGNPNVGGSDVSAMALNLSIGDGVRDATLCFPECV